MSVFARARHKTQAPTAAGRCYSPRRYIALLRAIVNLVSAFKIAFLPLVAFGAAVIPQAAQATLITATFTGTVSSGTDESGIFGPTNGDLSGQNFTLVYTFDDTLGTESVTDCPYAPCISSNDGVTPSTASSIYGPPGSVGLSAGTAVLAIGSGTYTFGVYSAALETSVTSSAYKSVGSPEEISFGVVDYFVDGGYDNVVMDLSPALGAPPFGGTYDWRSAFTDSQIIGVLSSVGGSFTVYYALNTSNSNMLNANGILKPTTVTVSAPANPLGKTQGDCGCAIPSTVGQAGVGHPITVGTGNMFEQVTDYATTGQNPLSFTRYYNSLGSTINSGTNSKTLGVNWRGTYDSYLHITPITGQATTVIAERADGQVISFTFNGSTWTTDTDVDASLAQSGSTWTLKDHNDTVFTYSASSSGDALLTSITLRNGYTQNLTYSGNKLRSVIDSYGRRLGFSYYSDGMLEKVTTPDKLVLTYGFTAATGGNQLTSVSYNTTPVTSQTYVYENPAVPFALTGIIDENNNRFATWTYDNLGRGLTSQHGTGTSTADLTTLTYNSNDTATVANAFGVTDTYTFTTLQNVPKVKKISRAATSTTAAAIELFTYDANGYLASRTDWNGNKTTYVNNSIGLPTTIHEAVGTSVARTTTISYDPTFVHLPHQIITPGLTSTFVYDGSGNPQTRTDLDTTTNTVPYSTEGQTRVKTWEWSSTGEETSVQLPRTDVTALTQFTYDSTGALTQITDALDHPTTITSHTGGGLPLIVVDPNNVTTTIAYDRRLNLHTSTLSTTAGNLTTTYTHDPANNLISVQLPDKSRLTYGYDTAHRLTSITDLPADSITYTLDALGDKTLVQVKSPSDTVTQEHSGIFDALGRVLQDIGGMGQTTAYTYDKNGNALTIAPPSPSGVVTYTFDALNRRSTAQDPLPGGTTTYTYDAHDRVLRVEDANSHTTSYVYNGFGDRTRTVSPDSGTTVYYHDPDRNLTQVVKPGPQTTNITYDALDRPLTTAYPSDSTLNVSRTYDEVTGHGFGIDRLTSATDQVGSLSLTYDERGNATQESRVVTGAGTLATLTTFDAASRVSGITYPSGTLVAYGRNSMGRVTSVTAQPPGAAAVVNIATGISYKPFGQESTLTFGNGIKGAYGYDLDSRPVTRVDTGTAAVQKLTYAYYANDSVDTIKDAVSAANSQTLGYDPLDRLTSATSGAGGYGAYSFTWDPLSNIETQVINGTTTTYTVVPSSNRLAQWVTGSTTETVTSIGTGNISTLKVGSSTLDTFTYNQANEMASATTPSASATYKYDLVGQRLEKTVSGSYPILYQFSRTGGELLSENNLHNGQTADYIYLNGRPVGEVNPTTGNLYFTHTDRLDTPQKLTDSTQTVVWNALYQPFGGTPSVTGTLTTQSLRLPGQQFDAETGLNHNGFRDYAPALTRYIESDPIGLAGGMNTYQYAVANPLKYLDPNGQNRINDWLVNQFWERVFDKSLNSALRTAFPDLTPCQVDTLGDLISDALTAGVDPEWGLFWLAYDLSNNLNPAFTNLGPWLNNQLPPLTQPHLTLTPPSTPFGPPLLPPSS